MGLKGKVRFYKEYLKGLIETIKEDNSILNIKGLSRESFI